MDSQPLPLFIVEFLDVLDLFDENPRFTFLDDHDPYIGPAHYFPTWLTHFSLLHTWFIFFFCSNSSSYFYLSYTHMGDKTRLKDWRVSAALVLLLHVQIFKELNIQKLKFYISRNLSFQTQVSRGLLNYKMLDQLLPPCYFFWNSIFINRISM